MRAQAIAIAVCLGGCLAAPPSPSEGSGADGGDPGHTTEPDDAAVGAERCVPGSALDLVWVSEVDFDQRAQDQVTLRGLALVVNPGPDPIDLAPMSVLSSVGGGAVEATFALTGGELSLPAGEVMGALNTGASVVLSEVDDEEEWTNLHAPELDVVLRFDGTGVDTPIPLHLDYSGYSFDLLMLVGHSPAASTYDWARDATRTTAFCE